MINIWTSTYQYRAATMTMWSAAPFFPSIFFVWQIPAYNFHKLANIAFNPMTFRLIRGHSTTGVDNCGHFISYLLEIRIGNTYLNFLNPTYLLFMWPSVDFPMATYPLLFVDVIIECPIMQLKSAWIKSGHIVNTKEQWYFFLLFSFGYHI